MNGKIIREDGQILYEMAQIGKFDSFEIWVYGGEGPIPHFHLIKGDQNFPDFEACIKIEKAEYFHHSGKEGKRESKVSNKTSSNSKIIDINAAISLGHKQFCNDLIGCISFTEDESINNYKDIFSIDNLFYNVLRGE